MGTEFPAYQVPSGARGRGKKKRGELAKGSPQGWKWLWWARLKGERQKTTQKGRRKRKGCIFGQGGGGKETLINEFIFRQYRTGGVEKKEKIRHHTQRKGKKKRSKSCSPNTQEGTKELKVAVIPSLT